MTLTKNRIQVLHVDDDPGFANLSVEILEQEDDRIDVRVETDPKAGLALLNEDDFDCIISDYDMPRMDGIEFLEAVREEHPDLPFILFTGKGSEEVASEAISEGVTNYLQKESGTEQYKILVNKMLSAVEKQQTEQKLDQLRRQYTELVEQNLMGIYIIQHGEFVYANPRLAKIHGYDNPEDLVGLSPLDLIAPEERDRVQIKLERRVSGEREEYQYQTTGLRQDGEQIHIELHGSGIEYEGDPAVMGAVLDITERRETKEALIASEKRYRSLIESQNDLIVRVDTDNRFTFVNDAYCEFFGKSEEELLGEKFTPMIHEDDVEDTMQAMENLEEPPHRVTVEQRAMTEEGWKSIHWEDSAVLNEDGEIEEIQAVGRDITERKGREEEINRLKERLELAVEGANLGVWDWDMATDEVEFNDQWAAMLGYSLDELDSHLNAWEKRVHPDDIEAVNEALDAHIEGETDYYDTEHRMRTADGDWKWIRDVGKIFERDDDGEPTRAVGIHIDISDRKGHEQQLQALHGANRRLIDAESRQEVAEIAIEAACELLEFSVPSMWYTTNGEIELVANSEEHQKLVEEAGMQNPTHLPDSPLWEIFESGETTIRSPIPPENLPADVPIHSAILLPLGEEGVLACAARSEVEFSDRQVRIAEILARNVEVALDLLDQRRALERQQQFTNDLLDAIEDVVYVMDTNGDFIEWNRAFEAVTSYGGDQIESMNATDIFSDDDAEAAADAVEEAFETGRIRVELEFLTADDESIPYEFVANSFEDPDGEPVLAGIGRDRSLHVEYERTLEEQRDNLEVLNQVVRHDIRNDMNVIRGRAEMLEEHIDEGGREHLDAVLSASKSATDLTTTARDLAETMLSSQEDVEPVRLDVHLRDSIENARAEFQDAEITIDDIPDVRIPGNDLLEAVFRNLLNNAVLHNDKETPRVQISTTVDTKTCRVVVADNGPGIPDDQKETIFGKGETGLDSPGTGIGLYLVQTLVEQYGGEVWVEDNDPEGSVFVVELPIAE